MAVRYETNSRLLFERCRIIDMRAPKKMDESIFTLVSRRFRFLLSLQCRCHASSSVQLPTYLAYKLRATAVSVVPLIMARPSGNSVIS